VLGCAQVEGDMERGVEVGAPRPRPTGCQLLGRIVQELKGQVEVVAGRRDLLGQFEDRGQPHGDGST
jgi:hypothetical protein